MKESKGFVLFNWLIIIAAITLAILGYLVYAFFAGKFPFGGVGSGGNGNSGSEFSLSQQETSESVNSVVSEDIDEPVIANDIVDSDNSAVADTPPSLLIEVREDRISYDNKEISIEELEEIFAKYNTDENIWILEDTYHADKSTYSEVLELLNKYGFAFQEK